MSVAIRYQSRGGHVREMAEIISEGTGVEPISIDDPRAPLTEHVDVLFIGGALYKFKLDPAMEAYLEALPEGIATKAIVFGSSALTRRPIYLIQERLRAKNIDIHPMGLYMRGKPKPYLHEIGVPWAKREAEKIEREIAEGTYGQEPKAPIVQMIENANKKREEAEAKATAAAEGVAQGATEVADAVTEHVQDAAGKVEAEVDELAEKGESAIERRRAELERKKAELEAELASLAGEDPAAPVAKATVDEADGAEE